MQELQVEVDVLTQSTDPQLGKHQILTTRALIVCVVALVITVTCAITGITLGLLNDSSAFLAFGCDGAGDIFAALFILWRFAGKTETEEQLIAVKNKENRASVGIAFALVIIGIATIIQAIVHLADNEPPNDDALLFVVSGVLGGLLLAVSLVKFYLAYRMQSLSLRDSGISDISGFFLSMGVLVANGVYLTHPGIWYLDATFAIIISLFIAGVGGHTLLVQRDYHWWTAKFWWYTEVRHE